MNPATFKIFAGSSNPQLARSICESLGMPLGEVQSSRMKSGEIYVSFKESLRSCDVFIVQSLSHPINDHLMELLIMVDAAKRASARTVNIVVPYYGYARQERKAAPREPISAKLVADLMATSGATRIITMDLHTSAIQGFFNIPLDHLTALDSITDYLKNKGIDNPVIVSPDAGRASTAEKLSNYLQSPFAIMLNHPEYKDPDTAKIIGDIEGRTPIIIEDMIDTGGTVLSTIAALQARGALPAYVCATHGLFSNGAIDKLAAQPGVREVVVTNSILLDRAYPDNFVVLSVADLLAEAIHIILQGGSIATLFKSGGI